MEQIVYLPVKDLKPYKNNPRKNAGAVDAVAASISEFGFRSPIIITDEGEVINGHTRLKAAKKLGIKDVPCIRVSDLTEEQIRQYRLIDNKTSEYASWDSDLLEGELLGMDFSGLDFEFDFTDDLKKRKKWANDKIRCDLKDHICIRRCNDTLYQALFKTGKQGIPLEDIKVEENVDLFAGTAVEHIKNSLGSDLETWCIVTTPRRRHKEGFHFATEVSRQISGELGICFYENAFESENTTRLNPIFNMLKDPAEHNVIIYDDVLTTGYTLQEVRRLLIESGHITYSIVSIDNH